MQQPLVSVIVPAYNHAGYLRQRLQSILAQTYSNIELILLDDASTDGSGAILQELSAHPKVKAVERNRTNSGSPIAQWLKGLSLATADWVWMAESDDEASPEFLSAFMQALEANPRIVLFASASLVLNEATGDREQLLLPYSSGRIDGRQFFLAQMLIRNALPNASAVVFNRRWITTAEWESIGTKTWVGDWQLWNMLLLKGDLYYDDRALNLFRRSAAAASNRWYNQGFLFREGLPMVWRQLKTVQPGLKTKLVFWLRWSRRLRQYYREQPKQGFATAEFLGGWKQWAVLHLLLPATWWRR